MPNRLSEETSPYLLQHANNPVEWYPWGPEAFARARAENKPILLSVGYSACHWCHVMEHESFEDAETAAVMNEHFVAVKVDREERPDVDSIYMAAVQQMTGHGGWPMTVFLTPEGAPFYGGTYFPPEPRHGLPSFSQVLAGIQKVWTEQQENVRESAGQMTQMLRQETVGSPAATTLSPHLLDTAFRKLASRFDAQHGGFGPAPKFPQPMILDFLLRHWKSNGEEKARLMVIHTLRLMARGGIYDQLGGGFHRYSVDAQWLTPHFEKMLYDNALLSRLYLSAYLATNDSEFKRVTEETLDYVLREMTSPSGAFYSAQDADSEGEEGKFYVWSLEEVVEALGPEDGHLFRSYYDVTKRGNFEGQNILHIPRPPEAVAAELGIGLEELSGVLERTRGTLYRLRTARVWPGLDDKALTSWNAMMMRAMAEAGRALGRKDYTEAAVRNARFLKEQLLSPEEGLLRTYKEGAKAKIPAFLEDYALFADALVSLYQATFDAEWIELSRSLADRMLERFWSVEEERFYDTQAAGEQLIVRPRDVFDNATPSGNSAAAMSLLRLASLTGDERYIRVATHVLEDSASLMEQYPHGFGELLCALSWSLSGGQEVAIVGEPRADETIAMLQVLSDSYLPNTVVALRDPSRGHDAETEAMIPLLAAREAVNGLPTAYVCQRFSCQLPVTDSGALAKELENPRS